VIVNDQSTRSHYRKKVTDRWG